jgi:hypothetical protein
VGERERKEVGRDRREGVGERVGDEREKGWSGREREKEMRERGRKREVERER